jgi:hypothetical protein
MDTQLDEVRIKISFELRLSVLQGHNDQSNDRIALCIALPECYGTNTYTAAILNHICA